jgi:ankyrin repeat protein
MSACLSGSTATVRVLLEYGANVDHCERKVGIFNMHTHFEQSFAVVSLLIVWGVSSYVGKW